MATLSSPAHGSAHASSQGSRGTQTRSPRGQAPNPRAAQPVSMRAHHVARERRVSCMRPTRPTDQSALSSDETHCRLTKRTVVCAVVCAAVRQSTSGLRPHEHLCLAWVRSCTCYSWARRGCVLRVYWRQTPLYPLEREPHRTPLPSCQAVAHTRMVRRTRGGSGLRMDR